MVCSPFYVYLHSDFCLCLDKLVLTAREGFGILCDCIAVLQKDVPEGTFEKMIEWSLEGIKQSSTWEVSTDNCPMSVTSLPS